MSIHDTVSFDKDGKPVRFELFRRLFVPLAVLLVGLLGFGLGRLSGAGEKPPVRIQYDPNIVSALSASSTSATSSTHSTPSTQPTPASPGASSGEVYASSKGTKYYYPSCKSTVSATNKVTFASAAMAEAAGYTLATNCKAP